MIFFVITMSIVLLVAGCGRRDEKTYIFATDPTSPPFEYYENGRITGYEIELLELIGEKTGTRFEVVDVLWDNIFSGVIYREYDGAASNITITDS